VAVCRKGPIALLAFGVIATVEVKPSSGDDDDSSDGGPDFRQRQLRFGRGRAGVLKARCKILSETC
jgi:hypothetical protein